ncbi:hypothetical protein C7C56_008065 [Massilia glaciei]|uniref:Uncharacterized protein n=2 Tax=Massilia glaciei TaxID=1524097 RepID=A0A2U2HNS1_9BURK|nr:hypothetical protein C7C56_008065 [Massilia glaciei]
MMVAGTALGIAYGDWRKSIAFGAGFPAGCLLAIVWPRLVLGLVIQNSPARALLSPQLRIRLMRVFLAGCALASAALALIISFHTGQFVALTLGIAAFLLLSALTIRYKALLFNVIVVTFFTAQILDVPWRAILGNPLVLTLLTLLLFAFGSLVARLLIQNGGDAHAAFQARLLKHPLMLATMAAANQQLRLGRIEAARLRRHCARRAPASTMLGYLLGPSYQWLQLPLVAIGGAGALWLALRYALPPGAISKNLSFMITCWSVGLSMLAPLTHLFFLDTSFQTKRNEQILLRLAPAIPQGSGLNRAFANTLMRRFLASWTVALLSATVVLTLHEASLDGLAVIVSGAVLLLPLAALPLQNYADARAAKPSSRLALSIIAIVALACVMGVLTQKYEAPWLLLIGVYGAASVLLIHRRWLAMVAAPVAFPVGRMTQRRARGTGTVSK